MPKYQIVQGQEHYMRNAKGPGMNKHVGGDVIELTEDKARAIRDKIVPIGETDIERDVREAEEEVVENLKPLIVERDDELGFDVINAETGQPMNDLPLDRDEAEAMANGTEDEE